MSLIKKLAGQTAVYGLSSIVGRLLNYLLVPLYTRIFSPEQFGVVTELYAYVSFLIIILTYGLETTLFRFTHSEEKKEEVYSTILITILTSTSLFIFLSVILSPFITEGLGYESHPEYIYWFILIIAFDAASSIPFAKLREQNKAVKFVSFKLINIFTNIGFNLFFLVLSPIIYKQGGGFWFEIIDVIYNPEIGIGYIFISNLISSIVTILLLFPYFYPKAFTFNPVLFKSMMIYSMPLMVAGLAGMTNETADRILIKHLLPADIALYQLGIYGACYKVAVLMTIFIQAFRFAAEPFFFAQASASNRGEIYAAVMHYFIIAGTLIFLSIMLYIDKVQLFVGEQYREGIVIVPILLLANLFLGIFINLSIWYKLTGKTIYGAYLTGFGAIITIVLNIILIPQIGYLGAAWTTLICYTVLMLLSYILGQRNFYINYDVKAAGFYIIFAVFLYFLSTLNTIEHEGIKFFINSLGLLLFIVVLFLKERRKKVLI
ncbi:MAG: oligosaccharide flippase family protein [Bacteroidetes bacterium]|nr:oligosaccharide flippase family protein [Bacteroidota bacterium]